MRRTKTVLVQRRGEIVLPIAFRRRMGLTGGTVLSVEQVGDALVLRKVATVDPARVAADARATPSWGSDLFTVYRLLSERAMDADELREALGWSAGRVYSALLELVVRGAAVADATRRYRTVCDRVAGFGEGGGGEIRFGEAGGEAGATDRWAGALPVGGESGTVAV